MVCPAGTQVPPTLPPTTIHLGGRQEFGHNPKIQPFINGSVRSHGVRLKESGIGTSTNFSLAIGAG
jgi:hypothetical protein